MAAPTWELDVPWPTTPNTEYATAKTQIPTMRQEPMSSAGLPAMRSTTVGVMIGPRYTSALTIFQPQNTPIAVRTVQNPTSRFPNVVVNSIIVASASRK